MNDARRVLPKRWCSLIHYAQNFMMILFSRHWAAPIPAYTVMVVSDANQHRFSVRPQLGDRA
jgi:hypothetical protein